MIDKNRKFRVGDTLAQDTDNALPNNGRILYRVLKEETQGGKVYLQIIEQDPVRFTENAHHVSSDYLRRATELISEGPEPEPSNRVTHVRGDHVRLGETIRHESHYPHLSGDFLVEGIEYKGDTVQILTRDKPDGVLLTVPQPVKLPFMKYSMIQVIGKRAKKHPPLVHWNKHTEKDADVKVTNRSGMHWSMHCGVKPAVGVMARNADFVTCPRCHADALEFRRTSLGRDWGV